MSQADCLILDHAGNVALHGLPNEAFTASLDGIPKVRRPSDDVVETKEDARRWQRWDVRDCAPWRFGDPDAELQSVQKVALVRADTGKLVVPCSTVMQCALQFMAPSYCISLSKPTKPGGMYRAECGDRAAFLDARLPWGPAWRKPLGELLATPRRAAIMRHADNLLCSLAAGKVSSAEWVADRIVEQWGDTALRPLLAGTPHPEEGFNPLRASREGSMMLGFLRRRLGDSDSGAPPRRSRRRKMWPDDESVTLLVIPSSLLPP